MNILHTETLKKWGGQQNRILAEATGFIKRGHKVVIACHKGSVLAQKAKQAGIKVHEMNMTKNGYLPIFMKVKRIIKDEQIDLVSTHSSVDTWAGGTAAKLSGKKLVRFRQNLYPIGRGLLAKFIYSIPDRLIASSGAIKNLLIQRGFREEKIAVIPETFDMQIFNPDVKDLREELKISPETLIIGNTSTFTEVKGQEYLLQAFNIISKMVPCILLFAGRLPEPARSRYLSHVSPEFRDKVIFLGHRDDVQRVLKTIDIFVYPSWLEGLGTALVEAMAMERAVAVSDIPTFREFVEDNVNGVYFKVKDPDDIAEKVILLARNKDFREQLGSGARATALEKFTLDRMIDLTEACYKEVLDVA
ncbi:MAG: glycosyltransferase family 4 protein [Nitrospirae bacterium]|nr:glycosyltransferase family 4 protein [Nitrospirota bacterium]